MLTHSEEVMLVVADEETVGEVTVVALFYENCSSLKDSLILDHRM